MQLLPSGYVFSFCLSHAPEFMALNLLYMQEEWKNGLNFFKDNANVCIAL